jgi:hypothetical protein
MAEKLRHLTIDDLPCLFGQLRRVSASRLSDSLLSPANDLLPGLLAARLKNLDRLLCALVELLGKMFSKLLDIAPYLVRSFAELTNLPISLFLHIGQQVLTALPQPIGGSG